MFKPGYVTQIVYLRSCRGVVESAVEEIIRDGDKPTYRVLGIGKPLEPKFLYETFRTAYFGAERHWLNPYPTISQAVARKPGLLLDNYDLIPDYHKTFDN